jgi:hypothetical protein
MKWWYVIWQTVLVLFVLFLLVFAAYTPCN